MIPNTLIAALERAQREQADATAKSDDPEEFKQRFAALCGRGGKTANEPPILDGDDTPPERLPDDPTVPSDAQSAEIPPVTPSKEENRTTTPQKCANATQGGKSRKSAKPGRRGSAKGGRKGGKERRK